MALLTALFPRHRRRRSYRLRIIYLFYLLKYLTLKLKGKAYTNFFASLRVYKKKKIL